MRMPRFADLDDEQRSVYQGAPPDGSILVVGPPGTGKTVMAFHRATYLKKEGQAPRVIMFNSVLAKYVSAGNSHAKGISVTTMHSWAQTWFRSLRLGQLPMREKFVHDWPAIAHRVNPAMAAGAAHWGHLIVDEGQDFPQELYVTLALLLQGYKGKQPGPALSVFADENQRLTKTNSTIAQIRQALALLGENRVFELTSNYRNTIPIARFAAHFYCGLSTGIPKLPSRKGKKPAVSFHKNQSAMIESICELIEEARDQGWSVGIVCPRDRTRRYVVRELEKRYENDADVLVQSYSSKDVTLNAGKLVFDKAGSVTILSRPSVKGLEFDAVCIVDPFLVADAAGSGEQQFKMNMYVSSSRAREYLRLFFVSDRETVQKVLPPAKDGLYEEVEG